VLDVLNLKQVVRYHVCFHCVENSYHWCEENGHH